MDGYSTNRQSAHDGQLIRLQVLAEFALRYPERVNRLVLVEHRSIQHGEPGRNSYVHCSRIHSINRLLSLGYPFSITKRRA
jgi:hypothetical protein